MRVKIVSTFYRCIPLSAILQYNHTDTDRTHLYADKTLQFCKCSEALLQLYIRTDRQQTGQSYYAFTIVQKRDDNRFYHSDHTLIRTLGSELVNMSAARSKHLPTSNMRERELSSRSFNELSLRFQ
jgi:hypothetical protein